MDEWVSRLLMHDPGTACLQPLCGNGLQLVYSSEFDPWRETGMSSEGRPGGPLQSSDNVAVFLMQNAEHADDAITPRGLANLNLKVNPEVVKTQNQSIEIIKRWIAGSNVG